MCGGAAISNDKLFVTLKLLELSSFSKIGIAF
jgi:hypothetical protein